MAEKQKSIWQVGSCREEDIRHLSRQLNLSPFLAKLLCCKGFADEKAAQELLGSSVPSLLSPFAMADMEKGAGILARAIQEKKQITVFGDYDVDGITATVIALSHLQHLGAKADFFIPDRFTHGYGLKKELLKELKERGTRVVLTVDCGISSREEALYARELELELVISDHHACLDQLPEAPAVINPNRTDCPYPFKLLAGCGVAWKLMCALDTLLTKEDSQEKLLEQYADLLALGTVADVMPLRGENRIFVQKGLNKLKQNPHPGLQALLQVAQEETASAPKPLNSSTLSFLLAPRLNAAGRMKHACLGVRLFTEQQDRLTIAKELCSLNSLRKQMEDKIYKEAVAQLSEESQAAPLSFAFAAGVGWHPGIIGIVASRISEKSHLPCILVSFYPDENSVGKGSGRSIKGFHLAKALSRCSEHLEAFGGHELAAGITVKKEKLPLLKKAITAIAKEEISPDMRKKQIECDCSLSGEELSLDNALSLQQLEPFGADFPAPLFFVGNALIKACYPLSEGKHMKLILDKDGNSVAALCFQMPASRFPFQAGDRVDLACSLDVNTYQNVSRVQLVVKTLRSAEPPKE